MKKTVEIDMYDLDGVLIADDLVLDEAGKRDIKESKQRLYDTIIHQIGVDEYNKSVEYLESLPVQEALKEELNGQFDIVSIDYLNTFKNIITVIPETTNITKENKEHAKRIKVILEKYYELVEIFHSHNTFNTKKYTRYCIIGYNGF